MKNYMTNNSMLIRDDLININEVHSNVQNVCEEIVPIESALEHGRGMLNQYVKSGLDLNLLISDAKEYSDHVKSYRLPDAVAHYWRKSGMKADLADKSFETIRNVLSIFRAWRNQIHDTSLGLPDKFDLIVWHGFILQTREYQDFCKSLGKFVHHRTTEGGQGTSCMLTLAIYEATFGEIDPAVWGEIDEKHIVFGWCSSCDD